MTIANTVTCNLCGAVKKDVNHWYAVVTLPGQVITIITWSVAEEFFAANKPSLKEALHLCGQACVRKELDRFFGGGQ